jgi:RNA polymerase sigma-70 factor (ECF subfamily)
MTEQRPAELPDAHLVAMAQRDPAQFVHLYDRYVDAIYRYCARRLSPTAAEDATSVAFLNALKAIDGFDPGRGGFRPWLYRIAHNAVIDQLRVRSHAPIDGYTFEDPDTGLDDRVVALDQRDTLLKAVRQLPPDQQQAIHLRLASLTGAEIAEAMGRSHVAVRALQHRAIKRLRILLQPIGKEDQNDD